MTVIPFTPPSSSSKIVPLPFAGGTAVRIEQENQSEATDGATAVVYCEGNFGGIDGKTANGLVRYSEKYKILAVIDSQMAGHDAGKVLDGKPNAIPIFCDLAEALMYMEQVPEYFIYGMAPASGKLSKNERTVLLNAMSNGLSIVNGLHEFLNDDREFATAGKAANVDIFDIRRPRQKGDLRLFSGRIKEYSCPRIAVLGTDCAIGKRTTASVLTRALNARGIKAVMIATGQTGMIQGSRYGVALDAVPSQFCCGELEATVIDACEGEDPDVVIVEGQGALSHPAFCTSAFILRGSVPDAVILQHAPGRHHRCDFEQMKMPSPKSEIKLIQEFANTKVIGLTINHENMTDIEVSSVITDNELELGIPVTDALSRPSEKLVEMVVASFPKLGSKLNTTVQ